jgi:hypothetical protein
VTKAQTKTEEAARVGSQMANKVAKTKVAFQRDPSFARTYSSLSLFSVFCILLGLIQRKKKRKQFRIPIPDLKQNKVFVIFLIFSQAF